VKNSVYASTCSKCQARLRKMQDNWLSDKAVEIQSYADKKDYKRFYDALKTVYECGWFITTVVLNDIKNSSGDEIANVNFCTTTTYM